MKYFLLLAGMDYYPASRTGNWIDAFETLEEAQKVIEKSDIVYFDYKIGDCYYDWFEIVDLRKWIDDET